MKPAFWDTSALVPLCVRQKTTPVARRLLDQHQLVVWWATPVEIRSAFERLLRMGELTSQELALASSRLDRLRRGWRELQPSEQLRSRAESLLGSFPLKGADALQLAAAWIWTSGVPEGSVLISADAQMLEAARQLGFQVIPV